MDRVRGEHRGALPLRELPLRRDQQRRRVGRLLLRFPRPLLGCGQRVLEVGNESVDLGARCCGLVLGSTAGQYAPLFVGGRGTLGGIDEKRMT